MALVAIGNRVQELRALPFSNLFSQRSRSSVDRKDVVAVPLYAIDADGLGARERPGAGGHGVGSGGGGPAVVLADEEQRELVDLGPVEALEEGTAVDRAVAEEAGDEVLARLHL